MTPISWEIDPFHDTVIITFAEDVHINEPAAFDIWLWQVGALFTSAETVSINQIACNFAATPSPGDVNISAGGGQAITNLTDDLEMCEGLYTIPS